MPAFRAATLWNGSAQLWKIWIYIYIVFVYVCDHSKIFTHQLLPLLAAVVWNNVRLHSCLHMICCECGPYDIKRQRWSSQHYVWMCVFDGTWSQVLSLCPHFLRAWTPRLVTLEYSGACEALQSSVRMSPPALGSFDKQSIYWYMIKYARNHPLLKATIVLISSFELTSILCRNNESSLFKTSSLAAELSGYYGMRT